jgi:heterotetrameric sarcosine oxidase delta subunit
MNILPCPWCGDREETEFYFGGETTAVRPAFGCTDEEWADYLYFRDNPRGRAKELWCHSWGCGEWFVVGRDTASHEVEPATTIAGLPTEARE